MLDNCAREGILLAAPSCDLDPQASSAVTLDGCVSADNSKGSSIHKQLANPELTGDSLQRLVEGCVSDPEAWNFATCALALHLAQKLFPVVPARLVNYLLDRALAILNKVMPKAHSEATVDLLDLIQIARDDTLSNKNVSMFLFALSKLQSREVGEGARVSGKAPMFNDLAFFHKASHFLSVRLRLAPHAMEPTDLSILVRAFAERGVEVAHDLSFYESLLEAFGAGLQGRAPHTTRSFCSILRSFSLLLARSEKLCQHFGHLPLFVDEFIPTAAKFARERLSEFKRNELATTIQALASFTGMWRCMVFFKKVAAEVLRRSRCMSVDYLLKLALAFHGALETPALLDMSLNLSTDAIESQNIANHGAARLLHAAATAIEACANNIEPVLLVALLRAALKVNDYSGSLWNSALRAAAAAKDSVAGPSLAPGRHWAAEHVAALLNLIAALYGGQVSVISLMRARRNVGLDDAVREFAPVACQLLVARESAPEFAAGVVQALGSLIDSGLGLETHICPAAGKVCAHLVVRLDHTLQEQCDLPDLVSFVWGSAKLGVALRHTELVARAAQCAGEALTCSDCNLAQATDLAWALASGLRLWRPASLVMTCFGEAVGNFADDLRKILESRYSVLKSSAEISKALRVLVIAASAEGCRNLQTMPSIKALFWDFVSAVHLDTRAVNSPLHAYTPTEVADVLWAFGRVRGLSASAGQDMLIKFVLTCCEEGFGPWLALADRDAGALGRLLFGAISLSGGNLEMFKALRSLAAAVALKVPILAESRPDPDAFIALLWPLAALGALVSADLTTVLAACLGHRRAVAMEARGYTTTSVAASDLERKRLALASLCEGIDEESLSGGGVDEWRVGDLMMCLGLGVGELTEIYNDAAASTFQVALVTTGTVVEVEASRLRLLTSSQRARIQDARCAFEQSRDAMTSPQEADADITAGGCDGSDGNGAAIEGGFPVGSWELAILWDLFLFCEPPRGHHSWPAEWLEKSQLAREREDMLHRQGAVLENWQSLDVLQQDIQATLACVGVPSRTEVEARRNGPCVLLVGVVPEACFKAKTSEIGCLAARWLVEVLVGWDFAGCQIREGLDPTCYSYGELQLRRLTLARAGWRVIEVGLSTLSVGSLDGLARAVKAALPDNGSGPDSNVASSVPRLHSSADGLEEKKLGTSLPEVAGGSLSAAPCACSGRSRYTGTFDLADRARRCISARARTERVERVRQGSIRTRRTCLPVHAAACELADTREMRVTIDVAGSWKEAALCWLAEQALCNFNMELHRLAKDLGRHAGTSSSTMCELPLNERLKHEGSYEPTFVPADAFEQVDWRPVWDETAHSSSGMSCSGEDSWGEEEGKNELAAAKSLWVALHANVYSDVTVAHLFTNDAGHLGNKQLHSADDKRIGRLEVALPETVCRRSAEGPATVADRGVAGTVPAGVEITLQSNTCQDDNLDMNAASKVVSKDRAADEVASAVDVDVTESSMSSPEETGMEGETTRLARSDSTSSKADGLDPWERADAGTFCEYGDDKDAVLLQLVRFQGADGGVPQDDHAPNSSAMHGEDAMEQQEHCRSVEGAQGGQQLKATIAREERAKAGAAVEHGHGTEAARLLLTPVPGTEETEAQDDQTQMVTVESARRHVDDASEPPQNGKANAGGEESEHREMQEHAEVAGEEGIVCKRQQGVNNEKQQRSVDDGGETQCLAIIPWRTMAATAIAMRSAWSGAAAMRCGLPVQQNSLTETVAVVGSHHAPEKSENRADIVASSAHGDGKQACMQLPTQVAVEDADAQGERSQIFARRLPKIKVAKKRDSKKKRPRRGKYKSNYRNGKERTNRNRANEGGNEEDKAGTKRLTGDEAALASKRAKAEGTSVPPLEDVGSEGWEVPARTFDASVLLQAVAPSPELGRAVMDDDVASVLDLTVAPMSAGGGASEAEKIELVSCSGDESTDNSLEDLRASKLEPETARWSRTGDRPTLRRRPPALRQQEFVDDTAAQDADINVEACVSAAVGSTDRAATEAEDSNHRKRVWSKQGSNSGRNNGSSRRDTALIPLPKARAQGRGLVSSHGQPVKKTDAGPRANDKLVGAFAELVEVYGEGKKRDSKGEGVPSQTSETKKRVGKVEIIGNERKAMRPAAMDAGRSQANVELFMRTELGQASATEAAQQPRASAIRTTEPEPGPLSANIGRSSCKAAAGKAPTSPQRRLKRQPVQSVATAVAMMPSSRAEPPSEVDAARPQDAYAFWRSADEAWDAPPLTASVPDARKKLSRVYIPRAPPSGEA